MARMTFTRWEANRLVRYSYPIIGERPNIPFRLTRKRNWAAERAHAMREVAKTLLATSLWFAVVFILALGASGCGGSVDSAEPEQGTWCCTDDAVEPSASAQTLTCYLTEEDAAAWTLGTCADSKLPECIPHHPGDSRCTETEGEP